MNWSYFAGFFDGEGSVTRNGNGYRITISQTNFLVLDEIRRWAQCGSIRTVATRRAHWKQSWTFAISKQGDVLHFLKKVHPWLIVKKPLVNSILPQLIGLVRQQQHSVIESRVRREKIRKLRHQGLTYRAIGKITGLDWGYVRRVVLSSEK